MPIAKYIETLRLFGVAFAKLQLLWPLVVSYDCVS